MWTQLTEEQKIKFKETNQITKKLIELESWNIKKKLEIKNKKAKLFSIYNSSSI